MKRYGVRHETHYRYGTPVDLGLHTLRLTPVDGGRQKLLEHSLEITPQPHALTGHRDHFGNDVHQVSIEARHDSFSVVLNARIEVSDSAIEANGPPWEQVAEQMRGDGFPAPPDVAEYIYASPLAQQDQAATSYVHQSFAPGALMVSALRDLLHRMREDFAYTAGVTDVTTTVAQVMETRAGVCQDFAHVMIAGLRGLGLPARYVSGYLRTYPPEGPDAWRGADASHAWVSVWCGEAIGWLDCDPTNDLLVGDEHIAVAYGRDFSDVTPLRGVILGGGQHTLSVAVTVDPLPEEENA